MSLTIPAGDWPTDQQLALLRARIGLAPDDDSKDLQIEAAWEIATLWVEVYLDRFLIPGTYTETFTHIARHVLSLKAYPVVDIISMDGDQGPLVTNYHVQKTNGLVFMDGFVISHELTIVYEAAPDVDGPLLLAMLSVFDVVWTDLSATQPTGGDGPVKAISSNGARVEFDLSAGGATLDASTGMPTSAVYVLNLFRRQSC